MHEKQRVSERVKARRRERVVILGLLMVLVAVVMGILAYDRHSHPTPGEDSGLGVVLLVEALLFVSIVCTLHQIHKAFAKAPQP
jgi:hypothetical protein